MNLYAERLLPHDIQAEEAVIGSVLIDGEAVSAITSLLKPNDFYASKNRWCYEAFLSLSTRLEAINQVTVAHELSQQDRLEEVGGSSYLAHLVRSVPTSVHIEHYAQVVSRTSTMRQLINVGADIASIGYESESSDVEGALSRSEELLFRIRTGRATRDFMPLREILDSYMEETASMESDSERFLAPIPSGFKDLDKLLGNGLQRSDMVVVAARPSLGKSTLAFNIARHAAEQGAHVGIFSLEMSAEQIGLRLVSSEANIDGHRLRLGILREEERSRELQAIGLLSELPLYIDETPIQGIVEMRGKASRLQMERGLDLLIVDYLQLMEYRRENRVQELGEYTRAFKGIARDLRIPVLVCSQLSRAPEQRPSHRPILSDLRESGSIEQDADVVAFIFREDLYTTRDEWEKRNHNDPYPENIAEIIVAKHRNGPTGTVPLYFRNDVVRFESLDLSMPSRT